MHHTLDSVSYGFEWWSFFGHPLCSFWYPDSVLGIFLKLVVSHVINGLMGNIEACLCTGTHNQQYIIVWNYWTVDFCTAVVLGAKISWQLSPPDQMHSLCPVPFVVCFSSVPPSLPPSLPLHAVVSMWRLFSAQLVRFLAFHRTWMCITTCTEAHHCPLYWAK